MESYAYGLYGLSHWSQQQGPTPVVPTVLAQCWATSNCHAGGYSTPEQRLCSFFWKGTIKTSDQVEADTHSGEEGTSQVPQAPPAPTSAGTAACIAQHHGTQTKGNGDVYRYWNHRQEDHEEEVFMEELSRYEREREMSVRPSITMRSMYGGEPGALVCWPRFCLALLFKCDCTCLTHSSSPLFPICFDVACLSLNEHSVRSQSWKPS